MTPMQHEDSPRVLSNAVVIYGVLRRASPHDLSLLEGQSRADGTSVVGGVTPGAQRPSHQDRLAGTHFVLRLDGLEVDTAARTVTFNGKPVELRRREYDLLAHLAAEPTKVYRRDELLRDVWGFKAGGVSRTVDSHAGRLRRALAASGAVGFVQSVWGVGYRLAR